MCFSDFSFLFIIKIVLNDLSKTLSYRNGTVNDFHWGLNQFKAIAFRQNMVCIAMRAHVALNVLCFLAFVAPDVILSVLCRYVSLQLSASTQITKTKGCLCLYHPSRCRYEARSGVMIKDPSWQAGTLIN